MPETPLPVGARCAIHPDRTAEQTCVRCGNYMCSECKDASGLCLTCTSRVGAAAGFPFTRDRYKLDGLVNYAFTRWKEHWPMFLLLFGGVIVAVYGVSIGGEVLIDFIADQQGESSPLHNALHPVRIGFQIATTILQLVLQLLVLGMCLDVLQGRPPQLQPALARLSQLPNAFLQLLLVYLALGVEAGLLFLLFLGVGGFEAGWQPFAITGAVALVTVPALVYVWLGLMFAMLVLLQDPSSNAFTSLATSWRIVDGHRFEVLGISIVAGIIAGAGALACCVGLFVTIPIASLLYCALFLALSNDTRAIDPPPAV